MNASIQPSEKDCIMNDGFFLAVILVVAVALFLVLREVVTWYFKLNEISRKLGQIVTLLEKQAVAEPAPRPRGPSPAELLAQARAQEAPGDSGSRA
jgi:hypothetical protein